ncbi:outer membrane beta-barrel protein [bacterium]|nr:outer membrane beta-barrel protein [bacterium]
MQKILIIYLMIVFIPSACSAELQKHWRLAGSYSIPGFSDTRDLAGDAWGVGFDYSFLGPDDENSMGGDISVAVDYKRFSQNRASASFSLNRVLIGLKWRAGAGATCEKEGLYGGIGIGLALINSVDSPAGANIDKSRATLEWSVFGGANFARSWFIEAGYNSFGEFLDFNWGNADVRFGLRF